MIGARLAVASDLDPLVELVALGTDEALGKRGGPQWERFDRFRHDPVAAELADDIAHRQRCQVLAGVIDDTVVGGASLVVRGTQARLVELFTHPRARRVGVGSALLTLAAELAVVAGATELESVALPGDRDTKNFFESHSMTSRLLVVSRNLS